MEFKLCCIGAGNMAQAILRGVLRSGWTTAERIIATDICPEPLEKLQKNFSIFTSNNNREAVSRSEVILLAIKPQAFHSATSSLASAVSPAHLTISIAAGIPLAAIEHQFYPKARIIRAMPNTPALVAAGTTALAKGSGASDDDLRQAETLFQAVGKTAIVEEKLLDAVTGLSGSGPAYVFVILEALADAGVKMGLPRNIAQQIATQTVLGSAKMQQETGLHPGQLKDQVASPAGTTIAGLHALELGALRATIINAVEAATERARELGKIY